jgi:hypothetical protein
MNMAMKIYSLKTGQRIRSTTPSKPDLDKFWEQVRSLSKTYSLEMEWTGRIRFNRDTHRSNVVAIWSEAGGAMQRRKRYLEPE